MHHLEDKLKTSPFGGAGLFGNPSTSGTNFPGANNSSSAGFFGNPANTAKPNQSNTLFGGADPKPFAFGAAANSGQEKPANTGGIFGSQGDSQSKPANLFGQTDNSNSFFSKPAGGAPFGGGSSGGSLFQKPPP